MKPSYRWNYVFTFIRACTTQLSFPPTHPLQDPCPSSNYVLVPLLFHRLYDITWYLIVMAFSYACIFTWPLYRSEYSSDNKKEWNREKLGAWYYQIIKESSPLDGIHETISDDSHFQEFIHWTSWRAQWFTHLSMKFVVLASSNIVFGISNWYWPDENPWLPAATMARK